MTNFSNDGITIYGLKQLRVNGPRIWNNLPTKIDPSRRGTGCGAGSSPAGSISRDLSSQKPHY